MSTRRSSPSASRSTPSSSTRLRASPTTPSLETPLWAGWRGGRSCGRRRYGCRPARVFLPYEHLPGEPNIGFQCSTGLAACGSLSQAILSGLCEDFERDAFILFWLDELPARRVHLEGSSLWRRFETYFAVPGYEYRIYDVTNDVGVPTALVLLICPSAYGELYIAGTACVPAGPGCREGAAGGRAGPALILSLLQQDPDWQPGPDFANVVDFEAHGRCTCPPGSSFRFSWGLRSGSPPTCRSRRFRGWEEGTCRGTSHGSRGAWPSGATKRWWWT